jgi:hypothetical protein
MMAHFYHWNSSQLKVQSPVSGTQQLVEHDSYIRYNSTNVIHDLLSSHRLKYHSKVTKIPKRYTYVTITPNYITFQRRNIEDVVLQFLTPHYINNEKPVLNTK